MMGKLPMGTCQLRISNERLKELELQPVAPIEFVISGDKQMINGQNFLLTK
jgi:hypothetical protein